MRSANTCRMASGDSTKEELEKAMIDRLADTEAHFKHQQRGEPDLTHEEKAEIAKGILSRNPAKFLEQYSKFLAVEDAQYFKDLEGDYVIDFYLQEIRKRHADVKQNVVKNRRYQAMQGLLQGGEYFSEDEMKRRDPLLFQQMVGQYESEVEQAERAAKDIDKSDLKFSTILLKHMDVQEMKQFYEKLKEREEEQEEEEEESDEEEDIEEDSDDEKTEGSSETKKESQTEEEEAISDTERNQLKNEFLKVMQERFLAGDDMEFDYKAVDTNDDYDSLEILDHDAEEKYFDSEQPHSHLRHPQMMVIDSASNSPICSSPSESQESHSERMDGNLPQRIQALELRGEGDNCGGGENSGGGSCEKKNDDLGSREDEMDMDDCAKTETSQSVSEKAEGRSHDVT